MKNLIILFGLMMGLHSCVNFTNIQSARMLGPSREKDHYVEIGLKFNIFKKGKVFAPRFSFD